MASSLPRRLLRLLVRTTIVLGVLVVGAYLLRGPLFGGLLRERLEDELTAAAGTRMTIGSIEGGWLSDLSLIDIDAPELAADGVLRRARVGRVAVRYRLLDLLDDPVAGLDAIDAEGLDVSVFLTDAADGSEPVDIEHSLSQLLRSFPDRLPTIRVAGRVDVASKDARLSTNVLASVPRRGEIDVALSDLEVASGQRTFRQDAVRILLRHDETAMSLEKAFSLGDMEVRSVRGELVDDGARIVASLGIGGDVEIRLDDDVLHATLRGVDVAVLPEALGDVLADALPALPAVVIDAEVDFMRQGPPVVAARDVRVVLGGSTLIVGEVRLGDVFDL